jgi:ribosomal protein S18 acetylase RimI-like enzyme
MEVNWRLASKEDIGKVVQLVNTAYRGPDGWTTEFQLLEGNRVNAQQVESILQHQDVGKQALLVFHHVVLSKSTLIGCVCLELCEDGKVAQLGMLSVAPSHQALGIGKMILRVASDFVLEKFNVDTIEISVIKQRVELISWYERHGYQRSGTTIRFPLDADVGRPLRKDLEFILMNCNLKSRL